MMVIMHSIDRIKIERSAHFVLDRASSVQNDAQGDTLLIDETIYTVVEDQPDGKGIWI